MFVHYSDIISESKFKTLPECGVVDFNIEIVEKGEKAINVKLLINDEQNILKLGQTI